MKSLILRDKIVTLEGIRDYLYGIIKTEEIGDMSLLPTETYFSVSLAVDVPFVHEDYTDGVLLRSNGNEYPMYFGANSIGANPSYITYGKKVNNRFILLQETFCIQDLYKENPDLGYCIFFDNNVSIKNKRLMVFPKEKIVYHMFEHGEESDLSVIGYENLEAIKESVEQYNKLFMLIKHR